jgi:hypothetical protein
MIYDKPCPLEQKYGANKLVLKAVYYSDKHGGYYGAYIVTRAIFDVYENALDNSTKIDEIEIWSPELYRNLLVMNRKSVFAINSGILNLSYDNKCKIIVKKFDSMKKYADLVKEDPLMTSWRNKMTLSGNLDNYKIKGAILKEYTGNEKIISLPPITNITLTTFSKSMVEEVRLPRTLMTVDDSRLFDACMNRTAHIIKFDKTNVDPYYNTSKLTSLQKKLFTFSTDKDNTELELDNLQYEF